jgi:RNA polymerase sigma-70 factor (ECF subfamily)
LRRVADWRDDVAWRAFRDRYERDLRTWCREYRLDDDLADEVCQDVWVEVADKIRSFEYDPSRRFRGWLRTRFQWRVVDAIERRLKDARFTRSLDDPLAIPFEGSFRDSVELGKDEPGPDSRDFAMFELTERIKAAVRARVNAQSWQVFWHIAIEGWTIRESADALNMTYVAAFAAHKRVRERLAREGKLRLAEMLGSITDSRRAAP